MGGGSYDRDVYSGSSSGGWDYRSDAPVDKGFADDGPDKSVLDVKKMASTKKKNPIAIFFDGTGSMGISADVVKDKMPMFFGQIIIQGYLTDPSVLFGVVGDITCDRWPIQIANFDEGAALDEWLGDLYLEKGGGGGHQESYEMFAYYALNMIETPNYKEGFVFFIGDEGFYEKITAEEIKEHFGLDDQECSSKDVFSALAEKYHVFLIHKKYNFPSLDKEILKQWTDAIGQEHVLVLEDPKSVVDVMLGAIALVSESRTLDTYINDLKGLGADPDRTQSKKRIKDVEKSLGHLSEHVKSTAMVKVETNITTTPKKKRTAKKTKRI